MNRRLCIYDFETNGFWNPKDKVIRQPIQVAIKIVELDGTEYTRSTFIKCPTPLDRKIIELTGITDQMLVKGLDIEKAFSRINDLMNVPETLIIGHNILTFDNSFANHYLGKYGYPLINKDYCFDTYGHFKGHLMQQKRNVADTFGAYHGRMIMKQFKGLKCKLPHACEYYGVKMDAQFHNAKADVDYTYGVFKEQVKDYDNKLPINKNRLNAENRIALGIDPGLF